MPACGSTCVQVVDFRYCSSPSGGERMMYMRPFCDCAVCLSITTRSERKFIRRATSSISARGTSSATSSLARGWSPTVYTNPNSSSGSMTPMTRWWKCCCVRVRRDCLPMLSHSVARALANTDAQRRSSFGWYPFFRVGTLDRHIPRRVTRCLKVRHREHRFLLLAGW